MTMVLLLVFHEFPVVQYVKFYLRSFLSSSMNAGLYEFYIFVPCIS